MNRIHVLLPGPSRITGSVQIWHFFWWVVSYPHSRCIIRCKTAEPSIFVIICSTGLSGTGSSVVQGQASGRSACKDAFQNIYHGMGRIFIIYFFLFDAVVNDDIAICILDLYDTGRFSELTVIGQRSISGSHLQRTGTIGKSPQCRRIMIIGFNELGKMHFLQITKTNFRCQFIKQLPCHRIQGMFYCKPQWHITIVAAVGVWRTSIEFMVVYRSPGGTAPLQSRGIYD